LAKLPYGLLLATLPQHYPESRAQQYWLAWRGAAMTNAEQRILKAVSETRLVSLCRELVRLPTVSPYSGDRQPAGEMAGQQAIEEVLRGMGGRTTRVRCQDELFEAAGILAPHGRRTEDRPNIVARFPLGTGQGPVIVLAAHMDTVGVDHYEGEPFSADLHDGFVHGRGSSDDKQGVAVMVEAVRALLEAGVKGDGTLVCCSVVDEECDGAGRGSLACIDHLGSLDAAIVIDGSFGLLCQGCTGVVTAEITVAGRAGHAAQGQSINAIEKACALLPAFAAFRRERGDRPGDLNLGVFQAGDHPANVPNLARLALNLKTYPGDMEAARAAFGLDSGRLVREHFERCVRAQAEHDSFLRDLPPQVRWIKDAPATEQHGAQTAWCEALAQAFAATGLQRPAVGLLAGWGDLAHFIRAGIPTVGLGAGWPGAAHSACERVSVAHLVGTARGLALALHRLLSGELPIPEPRAPPTARPAALR
jgi:acetylornithine deacetylase/succinyl-diaminopimelate desuccinylase-like protein